MNHMKPIISLFLILALSSVSNAKRRHVDFAENLTVSAPQDGEVCFSPDEPCGAKLTTFITTAQTSLDIAIYDINLDSFVHEILIQSKKMPVRLVVDRRQSKGPHSAVKLLLRAGIPLRYGHQRGIMHNKFVLIDHKRLETGSFNHTHHASQANSENQIYLSDPFIVKRYQDRFEKLWREADASFAE